MDHDCVAAIHRAYAVAMALPSPRPPARWKKQREERREKRAHGRQLDSMNFCRIPKRREGAKKSRTLEETREEHKEKREERDYHNPDERAEEGNDSVPEWCRKRSRLLGTESMA